MDRRSWLWRRKSSVKSPDETESSGSVSSYSERFSDDQEVLRASPNNASSNHSQSPEVSSNSTGSEVHVTVKSLSAKLSAALLNISAKDDLVKQQMKVAEGAVAGWEKAEAEVETLMNQLEAASQKNSALEDRIAHLDGALKESVKQLRHSREEHEQRFQDVFMEKTCEWESDKSKLENWISKLQVQLETREAEAASSIDHGLQSKLEAAEKENMALKVELIARTEDLQMQTLQKELSTRAAESASKQHLESKKKVAKLETECRRLQAVARKTSSVNDHKPISNSICVDFQTDSQSDSGEQLLGVDSKASCPDSWASALIAELDQFKNEKVIERNLAPSVEIDIMEDFLEMERLVAMPETDQGSSCLNLKAKANRGDSPLEIELDLSKMVELEQKVAKVEAEKAELENVLADTRSRLEFSHNQLLVAEDKLVVLQRHLDSTNESKRVTVTELVATKEKGKAVGYQLESAQSEVRKLHEKMHILQGQFDREKTASAEFAAKLKSVESTRKAFECQLEAANFNVKKLTEKVCTLEVQVEEEKAVSSKLTVRLEASMVERKALQCQLQSAHFEVKKLREKVYVLEREVKEEKAISEEYAAKVEASEAQRKAVQSQFELAHLEIDNLHEKAYLLEVRVQEETSLSAEFAVKVETAEAARKALDNQLKLAHLEVGEMLDKVSLLEEKVLEEKILSAKLAARYKNFEDGLSRKKQEADLQIITRSNGELKVTQDKELTAAAGKLVECQKTIASLSRQLKSLTPLDDFMLEVEKAI